MEFERLYAIGKDLGMTGAELKRWVDAEIAREGDQRAQNREDAKAQAEQDRLSPVFLLDRTIHYLPEAMVFLDTPFFTGLARVKCMRDPLYDVVLGNIEGARPPNDPVSLWSPDRTQSDTSPPSMRGPPTLQLGRPDIKDKGTNEVGNVASSQTQKLAVCGAGFIAAAKGTKTLSLPSLPGLQPTITGVYQCKLKDLQKNDGSLRRCFEKVGKMQISEEENEGCLARERSAECEPELHGRDPRSRPSVRPLKTCAWVLCTTGVNGILCGQATNRRRAFVPTHAWTVGDSIAARSTCRECVSVPSPRR
ncbi:hypothetical protein HPB52_022686 [Rhipicephalus sanguineus]|uniref:Uncharacterized protein n=1 Tax=Rhipicephalus sanguineus TaxID=34632 RepID=A0A9D4SV74_RHISA|nr:hypothetical protein HPB52_022686 [Rhipicephalus sanguineus]